MRLRYKMVAGFAVVVLLSNAIGLISIKGMSDLSALTRQMYDQPLMAISFAQSALTNFVKLDRALTLTLIGGQREVEDEATSVEEIFELVVEDLEVVQERFQSEKAQSLLAELAQLLEESKTIKQFISEERGGTDQDLNTTLQRKDIEFGIIEEKLDLLVEFAAEEGFDFYENAKSVESDTFYIQIAAILAMIAIGFGTALFLGRSFSVPIEALKGAMIKLAENETNVDIPGTERTDEIAEMAIAVQVFKENAAEKKRLEDDRVLTEKRAEADKKAAMNMLADSFEASVGGVVGSVSSAATQMQSTSASMSASTERAGQQAASVATAAEEATSNVQTVAAAAEELSSSIAEIGRSAAESSGITKRAVTEAERTSDSVRRLAEVAQKIGEVVNLIHDIAAQTNLLALNATIEAARAGEAGKGFAVVANEVKSLASQTAKATDEITSQISSMQEVTDGVVGAIEGIGKTIAEVNEIAAGIAAAVEEQSAATQEIAHNVQEAAQGTQDVTSNIGGVSQAVGDTGQAAGEALEAADELSRQADALRQEVDNFLIDVRAA